MRFENHVSVIWDITCFLDIVALLPSVHNHLVIVPPAPAPVPMPMQPAAEMASIIAHPPGALTGTHKLTSTVYHNHVWIALEKHDLGHALPHVCLVPGACVEMLMHTLFSSRKAKFRAGEVKANGSAIACCTMIDRAIIPTPMLICGSIPVPMAGCGMSVMFNSVLVGMSWVDLLTGWVDTLISMIQTMVMNMGPIEAGNWTEALGISPVPELGPLVAGAIALWAQSEAGYHGDASLGYDPVGGLVGGYGVSVSRDGASGDITTEGHAGVQAGGLAGGSVTRRNIYHPDGTVTRERTYSGTTVGGGQMESTRTLDGNGDPTSAPPRETSTSPSLPWSEGTEVPFL